MSEHWLALAPVGAFVVGAMALFVIDAADPDSTNEWLLSAVSTASMTNSAIAPTTNAPAGASASQCSLIGTHLRPR